MTAPRTTEPNQQNSEAGFTLFEVLVAFTLMGFLSAVIFGALHYGLRTWNRSTVQADANDNALFARNFLTDAIGRAYPLYLRDKLAGNRIDFDGQSKSMAFLAPTPQALGPGGRSRFQLFIDDRNGSADLLVSVHPELAADGDGALATTKTLIAKAADIAFAYLARDPPASARAWRDDWIARLMLPQLIRVRIRFRDDDPRVWPDLLIVPHSAFDVACAYDPMTSQCRGRLTAE
jgi:general secretion pathway protein J